MARSRNIKPGFFTNDVLGELPALTRLLFAGIWTLCDRDGRLEDRPKKIRAEVLPYDLCDAEEMLMSLEKTGFIKRYEASGVRVIQVLAWEKHQNPHVKEAASILPAPDQHQTSTMQEQCDCAPSPERAGLIPSLLIPDSGFLATDSKGNTTFAAPPAEDAPAKAKAVKALKSAKERAPTAETWDAYAAAYATRYKAEPVRNATVNGQLAQFVGRIGAEESPSVAAYFVGHQARFYVETGHSVGMLLRDAEKLRTEWATGRRGVDAQQAEPAWRRDARERMQAAVPSIAEKSSIPVHEFFEAEVKNVTPIALG